MEVCEVCDRALFAVQGAASLCDDGIEFVDCFEVPVDEGLIEERPQAFGGLQFWTVGRQKDEPDSVGDGQIFWSVPAGIVDDEEDDALASGACLACE